MCAEESLAKNSKMNSEEIDGFNLQNTWAILNSDGIKCYQALFSSWGENVHQQWRYFTFWSILTIVTFSVLVCIVFTFSLISASLSSASSDVLGWIWQKIWPQNKQTNKQTFDSFPLLKQSQKLKEAAKVWNWEHLSDSNEVNHIVNELEVCPPYLFCPRARHKMDVCTSDRI